MMERARSAEESWRGVTAGATGASAKIARELEEEAFFGLDTFPDAASSFSLRSACEGVHGDETREWAGTHTRESRAFTHHDRTSRGELTFPGTPPGLSGCTSR